MLEFAALQLPCMTITLSPEMTCSGLPTGQRQGTKRWNSLLPGKRRLPDVKEVFG